MGEALAIVRGPDAYITPAWYATKREHGRVVPTWNYITAHVHGSSSSMTMRSGSRPTFDSSPQKYEAERETSLVSRRRAGAVRRRPAAGDRRARAGQIGRIEAKFKLSQNRSEEDVAGVVAGLVEDGRPDMSESVRSASKQERR